MYPEDGVSRFIRNFDALLPDRTASHPSTEYFPFTAANAADIRRPKSYITGSCVSYVVTLEEWIFVVKMILLQVRV